MTRKRKSDLAPTDTTNSAPDRFQALEERCKQCENELAALRNESIFRRIAVKQLEERLAILEPSWGPSKVKSLNEYIQFLRDRSQAMASRMIVISEVSSLAALTGATRAFELLKRLLSIWDEPDEVWIGLGQIPMGEWIDEIEERVLKLRGRITRQESAVEAADNA